MKTISKDNFFILNYNKVKLNKKIREILFNKFLI